MIVRTRHWLLAALVMLAVSCGTADHASSTSNPALSVTLQDASNALTAAGITGDCLTHPQAVLDAAEGSTGVLACSDVTTGTSEGTWTIKVFAFEDDRYAEAGYQRSCKAMKQVRSLRWWTIWQQGQNWYAEVYATTGKPPRSVAKTFADALKSTPWDDCSGLG